MSKKIYVIKGYLDKVRVSNTGFTLLKPISINRGKATATVDASQLFGVGSKIAKVELEDYRLLD
jgi:hypothetical protein